MAKPTVTEPKDEMLSLLDSVETESEVVTSGRGKSYDPSVLRIREMLEQADTDENRENIYTIKFTTSDEDTAKREKIARQVRSAGKMRNKPEIDVTTRWNPDLGKFYWGPTANFNAVKAKKGSRAEVSEQNTEAA